MLFEVNTSIFCSEKPGKAFFRAAIERHRVAGQGEQWLTVATLYKCSNCVYDSRRVCEIRTNFSGEVVERGEEAIIVC